MQSFLQGKKCLPLQGLRAPGGYSPVASSVPGLVPGGTPPATSGSGPSVEVVKEGDKVLRLVVTCGCGERVEIECLYPGGL